MRFYFYNSNFWLLLVLFKTSTPVYVAIKGCIVDITAHKGSYEEPLNLHRLDDIIDLRHEKEISMVLKRY
jgi:hypothetical protein